MSKSLIFVAFCLLGGCVTSQDQSAQMASLRANIPKCSEQRQCEGMWAAARNWVSRSCGMKIQTMTDNFIETYTSLGTEAACRITKDPEPAGGYSFHVWVSFGNHYMTGAIEMAQNFQSTVNGAGEAFTTARAAR